MMGRSDWTGPFFCMGSFGQTKETRIGGGAPVTGQTSEA
jgi:hypothetical protein